jgi:hypothetical protein
MTIYLGDGIGDDPPPRHVNPTVSDDGYMAIGGQLVYVGVATQKAPTPSKPSQKTQVNRKPDPDAGWFCTDTQCIWIGDD